MEQQGFTEIQQAINSILSVKALVRRKKKKTADKKRELFISIINSIDSVNTRQHLMYTDLQLDFTNYDEPFHEIIDALIILNFGKEGADLISWYLWDRINPDGAINELVDQDGNSFALETPQELWNLLLTINPSLSNG